MNNKKTKYLYHGAKQQGLIELNPFEAGHNSKYVYATSNEVYALVFINRLGGSLVAKWGEDNKGVPYYCEKVEGILKRNYKGVEGSIYVVDKKLFSQDKKLHNVEFVSEKIIPVIKEIKINDLEQYFKKLDSEGKVNIIYYKDRLKFFPNIDKEIIEDSFKLIGKYGKDRILPDIQKYRSEVLDKILKKLN